MINARELRQGNLVIYEATYHIVRGTFGSMIYSNWINAPDEQPPYFDHEQNHSPIPLTEQWLLKAGFSYNEETNEWEKVLGNQEEGLLNPFTLWVEEDEFYIDHSYAPFFKYLHQLQNLFYFLTRTELEFNY